MKTKNTGGGGKKREKSTREGVHMHVSVYKEM